MKHVIECINSALRIRMSWQHRLKGPETATVPVNATTFHTRKPSRLVREIKPSKRTLERNSVILGKYKYLYKKMIRASNILAS